MVVSYSGQHLIFISRGGLNRGETCAVTISCFPLLGKVVSAVIRLKSFATELTQAKKKFQTFRTKL